MASTGGTGRRLRVALSFKLALAHLRASLRRLAVTILAIALGVGLVVSVRLMNARVLQSFLDTVDDLAGRAALTVTAGTGFTFDEAIVERIARVAGVRLAVPLVRGVAFPDDDSGELLTVLGVDLTNEAAVRVYHDAARPEDVVGDLLAFLAQPDSIIAGKSWAAGRGLGVGDRVGLLTPVGLRSFTIRGLVEPRGFARTLGGRVVVMDVQAAERAFTADRQINQVDVVLAPGAALADVKAAVAALLPSGLVVQEPAARRDVLRSTVRGFQAMLTAFALVAVLAGFVVCYSRLRVVFEARTWEVGLLRAFGIRQSIVFLELLKESLVIGLVGTAIGIALGLVLARWAFDFLATTTAIMFRMPVASSREALDGWAIALGCATGLVAAVSAAAVPAIRLARTQPVIALRQRGRTGPPFGTRMRLVTGVSLVAAAALAVVLQVAIRVDALGAVATVLLTLAALTLASPLVVFGGRALTWVFASLFGPTGWLAASEVTEQPRRAALTVATLGLGLGAVLLFGILGGSFEESVAAQLAARFRADLVIHSAFASAGWMTQPLRDDIVADVASVPAVRVVSGQQLREIVVDGTTVWLFSYDPPCFRDARVCRWPLRDDAMPNALDATAAGTAVIVSPTFARERGIGPGDRVTLVSPTGPQSLLVAAVAREEPSTAVIMSRERYRESWNDAMVTWVHVGVDDPGAAPAVAAELERRLGRSHRVLVRPVADFVGYLAGQVRQAFRLLYVMEAVTLALILFGLTDALAAGVMERTRVLGLMRAVGVRRGRIFGMVMLEGVALGLLGLLLAGAVGLGLSAFWVRIEFPMILGWGLGYEIPGRFVAIAVAMTIVLSLLGSLAPSLRAARLEVAEALKEE